jgi:hypothetical protein
MGQHRAVVKALITITVQPGLYRSVDGERHPLGRHLLGFLGRALVFEEVHFPESA